MAIIGNGIVFVNETDIMVTDFIFKGDETEFVYSCNQTLTVAAMKWAIQRLQDELEQIKPAEAEGGS